MFHKGRRHVISKLTVQLSAKGKPILEVISADTAVGNINLLQHDKMPCTHPDCCNWSHITKEPLWLLQVVVPLRVL